MHWVVLSILVFFTFTGAAAQLKVKCPKIKAIKSHGIDAIEIINGMVTGVSFSDYHTNRFWGFMLYPVPRLTDDHKHEADKLLASLKSEGYLDDNDSYIKCNYPTDFPSVQAFATTRLDSRG